MPFDYDRFVKELIAKEEEWKTKFALHSVPVTLGELGAEADNPFAKLYGDEHGKFLAQPHNVQQHRMQGVPVTNQGPSKGRSTFTVLRTDPGFSSTKGLGSPSFLSGPMLKG